MQTCVEENFLFLRQTIQVVQLFSFITATIALIQFLITIFYVIKIIERPMPRTAHFRETLLLIWFPRHPRGPEIDERSNCFVYEDYVNFSLHVGCRLQAKCGMGNNDEKRENLFSSQLQLIRTTNRIFMARTRAAADIIRRMFTALNLFENAVELSVSVVEELFTVRINYSLTFVFNSLPDISWHLFHIFWSTEHACT